MSVNESNENLWRRCDEIIANLRRMVVVLESAARSVRVAAEQTEKNNEKIKELNICLKEAREAFKKAEDFFKPMIESVEPLAEDYLTDTKKSLLDRTEAAGRRAGEYIAKFSLAFGNPALIEKYAREARVVNEEFRDLVLEVRKALPANGRTWDEILAKVDATIKELDEIYGFVNPKPEPVITVPASEVPDKNKFN